MTTTYAGQARHVDMTEHIRQSNLIEDVTDRKEVRQSLLAWAYLSARSDLTVEVINSTHQILMRTCWDAGRLWPNQRGKLRVGPVFLARDGQHVSATPTARDVPYLLDQWVTEVNARELEPRESHIEFEMIHPYADGNGRIGRMLMWHDEMSTGRKPTLIRADEREEYYKWFNPTGR